MLLLTGIIKHDRSMDYTKNKISNTIKCQMRPTVMWTTQPWQTFPFGVDILSILCISSISIFHICLFEDILRYLNIHILTYLVYLMVIFWPRFVFFLSPGHPSPASPSLLETPVEGNQPSMAVDEWIYCTGI